MIVGFDFDKVFIDYPPFIPYFFIDYLYKGSSVFRKNRIKNTVLHYRFPGTLEQKIRILSHYPIFRHPIKKNISALQKLSNHKECKVYLVSSRFGFLKKRTDNILNKYKLDKYFDGIYFNYNNQQPHAFKEETIKKLKIDTYIDDDLDLAFYLAKKIPTLKIYWVKDGRHEEHDLPKNITAVKDLEELYNFIQKK